MKKMLLFLLSMLTLAACNGNASELLVQQNNEYQFPKQNVQVQSRIRITVGETEIYADLFDNPAAKEFEALFI